MSINTSYLGKRKASEPYVSNGRERLSPVENARRERTSLIARGGIFQPSTSNGVHSQSTNRRKIRRKRKTYGITARIARNHLAGPSLKNLASLNEANLLRYCDPDSAINYANDVLIDEPKNIYALNIKAEALQELGETHEGIYTVELVLDQYPLNLDGLKTKVKLLIDLGDLDEALEEIKILKEHSDDIDILILELEILKKKGDFENALETVEKILKDKPNHFDVLSAIDFIHEEYREQENQNGLIEIVYLSLRLGNIPQAIEAIRDIAQLEFFPSDERINSMVYDVQEAIRMYSSTQRDNDQKLAVEHLYDEAEELLSFFS